MAVDYFSSTHTHTFSLAVRLWTNTKLCDILVSDIDFHPVVDRGFYNKMQLGQNVQSFFSKILNYNWDTFHMREQCSSSSYEPTSDFSLPKYNLLNKRHEI